MIALLTQWRILLPLALVGVAVAAYLWQDQIIDHLRGRLTTAETRATAIEGDARAQSAAVGQWRHATQLQSERVRATQLDAARTELATQIRLQTTLTAPVPEECTSAAAWAAQRAVDLGRAWRSS
jgi:hypothetical protein